MKITTTLLLAGLALTAPLSATAAADADTKAAAVAAELADGEVRKVDKAGGKITLKHGVIKSLDMPGMTMVFQVRDKALLDKVKAGDKVKFQAISDNGKLIVTEIHAAK